MKPTPSGKPSISIETLIGFGIFQIQAGNGPRSYGSWPRPDLFLGIKYDGCRDRQFFWLSGYLRFVVFFGKEGYLMIFWETWNQYTNQNIFYINKLNKQRDITTLSAWLQISGTAKVRLWHWKIATSPESNLHGVSSRAPPKPTISRVSSDSSVILGLCIAPRSNINS